MPLPPCTSRRLSERDARGLVPFIAICRYYIPFPPAASRYVLHRFAGNRAPRGRARAAGAARRAQGREWGGRGVSGAAGPVGGVAARAGRCGRMGGAMRQDGRGDAADEGGNGAARALERRALFAATPAVFLPSLLFARGRESVLLCLR